MTINHDDQLEQVERQIDNQNATLLCYRLLDDVVDKFIVMACLQLGYKQREVSLMLGIDQSKVSNRLVKSINFLRDTVGMNII